MEANKVPLHLRKANEGLQTHDTSLVILTMYGNGAEGAYSGTFKPYNKMPSIADQSEHPSLDDETKAYWEEKKDCLLNNVVLFADSVGCALNLGKV
jgi:hypothetical protein